MGSTVFASDEVIERIKKDIDTKGFSFIRPKDLEEETLKRLYENPVETYNEIKEEVARRIAGITGDFNTNIEIYLSGFETPSNAFLPRDVSARMTGMLVPITGIVKKSLQTNGLVPETLAYKCENYSLKLPVEPDSALSGGNYPRPTKEMVEGYKYPCNNPNNWILDIQSSTLVDFTSFQVEDLPERLGIGKLPKSVEVYFFGWAPREQIKIGSKVILYTAVNAIKPRRGKVWKLILRGLGFDIIDETEQIVKVDTGKVKQMAQDRYWYWKAIASVAPSIWGQWDLKESLLLALLGGVDQQMADGVRTRGRFHVLAITEPGIGKSDMVEYLKKVFPRTVYAVGMGSTGVGLTVSLNRTEFGWEINAGAVVLASGGVAVIDEIDKLSPDDRQYLHEVMEQQRITINKAGINTTITTPVTIIGLGNPKFSRYDPTRTLAENLNLPPSILSRFALVWVIRQTTNPLEAEMIAKWIWIREKYKPPIPVADMRQFIEYARRLKPRMTPEAEAILTKYYVGMVERMKEYEEVIQQPAPLLITPRQLLDLKRISEAYAKLFLSRKVTQFHAKLAIRLMERSLRSLLPEEEGDEVVDLGMKEGLTPITIEQLKNQLFEYIYSLVMEEIEKQGIAEFELDELVTPEYEEKLKKLGYNKKKIIELIEREFRKWLRETHKENLIVKRSGKRFIFET